MSESQKETMAGGSSYQIGEDTMRFGGDKARARLDTDPLSSAYESASTFRNKKPP